MENQVTHREKLLALAREAKTAPGVYLMKDERGEILYVGKAKSLRSRLASYFQTVPPLHPLPDRQMLGALRGSGRPAALPIGDRAGDYDPRRQDGARLDSASEGNGRRGRARGVRRGGRVP